MVQGAQTGKGKEWQKSRDKSDMHIKRCMHGLFTHSLGSTTSCIGREGQLSVDLNSPRNTILSNLIKQ